MSNLPTKEERAELRRLHERTHECAGDWHGDMCSPFGSCVACAMRMSALSTRIAPGLLDLADQLEAERDRLYQRCEAMRAERDHLRERLAVAMRALESIGGEGSAFSERCTAEGIEAGHDAAILVSREALAQLRGDTRPATGAELLDALADHEAPSVESLEEHLRDIRGDTGGGAEGG